MKQENRTPQAIANAVGDLEHMDAGQVLMLQEALQAALRAMAHFQTSADDNMDILAALHTRAMVRSADLFKRSELDMCAHNDRARMDQ